MRTVQHSFLNVWVALFISLVCSLPGRAQAYIPMLNGYSEWHVTNCYFGCNTDTYYTIGDTVVNLQHYTFLDRYHYNKNFLLREDTLNRKVYMRMLADTSAARDYLLYDFSAQVNDTVSIQNPGSPYPKYAGGFLVDSIVTKPLVNKNHRFFYLHSLDTITSVTKNTIWVEGIGSLCLINTPGAAPQINEVGQLSCFFHNGINEYANLDSITDCLPVYPLSVRNLLPDQNYIITQDFDSQHICVKNMNESGPFKVYIYNTAGQTELYREPLSAETKIYVGQLSKGLLLLKAENTKGEIRTYKFFNP